VSVKIEKSSKSGSIVRRVRLEDLMREAKSGFQAVTSYVKVAFPETPHFILKYQDDEGDLVTISSEAEFDEAVQLTKNCLKLHVVEVSPSKHKESSVQSEKVEHQIIDPLSVEFHFADQKATVILSKNALLGISLLKEKAEGVFPVLKGADFSLKYMDDEGDAVTMTEAAELQDALQLVVDGQVFVVVVSLKVEKVPVEKSKIETVQKEKIKKKNWEDVTWDDLNETLEKLQKLGFTDTALCTRLLEHHNYDYDAVLHDLSVQKEKEKY